MRAAVYDSYGTADALSVIEMGRPEIDASEVLVRTRAVAINRGDWYWLNGIPYVFRPAVGLTRPKHHVLGLAIAGEIAEVGSDVQGVEVGDQVFGEVPRGGFAEYAVAAPERLAPIPDGVSYLDASTLPVTGATGLQSLKVAEVDHGTKVLIVGGSGGVGTFAVQLAHHLGGEVTAVCGPAHVELVSSLGADRVIDYSLHDVTDGDEQFDAIIDIAGTHKVSALRSVLTPDGILVLTSGSGGPWMGPLPRMAGALGQSVFSRQKLRMFANTSEIEDLNLLAGMVSEGTLMPTIESVVSLDEIRVGMEHYGTGHAGGKVVIDMESEAAS